MNLLQAGSELSRATLFAGDKLGTVLTVVLIIFGGVVTWLVVQERRIRRLEQHSKNRSTEPGA